ncbi:MAG: hypothetical protein LBP74_02045 [Treponema sp.]|jgi:hypothetical protein|nr:hypothetical protein [Treponema sp.]
MKDNLGYLRQNFPLDTFFGIERITKKPFDVTAPGGRHNYLSSYDLHNYMRISKNTNNIVKNIGTDLLPFLGQYFEVRSSRLETVANLVPAFPAFPPEFCYMDDDKRSSGIPLILAGETGYGDRVVYFSGDTDRRCSDSGIPDMADILANAVLWALGEAPPFKVSGPGKLDCKLYMQKDALVMHLVNLSGLNEWPYRTEEYFPVGKINVSINTFGQKILRVCLKVADKDAAFETEAGWTTITIDSITDHEMIVLEM